MDGDGSMKPCAPVELAGFDVSGYELEQVTLRNLCLAGSETRQLLLKDCRGVCMENLNCVL